MVDFRARQGRHKMVLEHAVIPEIKEMLKINDGGMSQEQEPAWKGHRPNLWQIEKQNKYGNEIWNPEKTESHESIPIIDRNTTYTYKWRNVKGSCLEYAMVKAKEVLELENQHYVKYCSESSMTLISSRIVAWS